MTACIEAFATPEVVDDFYSTALQAKSVAQKWVTDIMSKHVLLFPCQVLSVWERRPKFEARGSRRPWKLREKLQHPWKLLKVGQFELFPKKNPSGFYQQSLKCFSEPVKIVVVVIVVFFNFVDKSLNAWDYRMKNARLT